MKQNLILLHGALGSMTQFSELTEILSPVFDIYTLNFSGHGGQVADGDFSIELFVKDTLDFMDIHQLPEAHIFGYSMGGYVALKLAHDHPQRVMKIITLGTKFAWNPESAAKEVRLMNPDIIEQKIPAFASTLAERHQPADWKGIMRHTGEMMTALGAGAAMTTADFTRIKHEVLVCIGTEDHMVTRQESENTARALPNGQLKIIDGFRHPLEAVDKEMLASVCKDFITGSHK